MSKEIGDEFVQTQLRKAGAINYNPLATLFSIRTTGDGNCLLHAAGYAMFGVEDSNRLLRAELARAMANTPWIIHVQERWRVEVRHSQAALPEAFHVTAEGLEGEWADAVLRPTLAPDDARPDGRPYGIGGCSLLGVHVYVLAHILRRPVVVYADHEGSADSGETLAGIYLPSLLPPDACSHSPVLVGYTPGHFTALVPTAPCTHAVLCSRDGVPLRVRFEDARVNWVELVAPYMAVEGGADGRPVARLSGDILPASAAIRDAYVAGAEARCAATPLSPG